MRGLLRRCCVGHRRKLDELAGMNKKLRKKGGAGASGGTAPAPAAATLVAATPANWAKIPKKAGAKKKKGQKLEDASQDFASNFAVLDA
jgi:hypothetical protein